MTAIEEPPVDTLERSSSRAMLLTSISRMVLLPAVGAAVGFLLLLARLPIPSLSQALQQSSLASYIFLILPYLRQLLPSDLHIFQVI